MKSKIINAIIFIPVLLYGIYALTRCLISKSYEQKWKEQLKQWELEEILNQDK